MMKHFFILTLFVAPLAVFGNGAHLPEVAPHDHAGYEKGSERLTADWRPVLLSNVIIDDHYQIAFDHTAVAAGILSTLTFTIGDVFGGGVVLEDFLETDMHLIITNESGSFYADVHPASAEAGVDSHAFFALPAHAHNVGNDLPHPVRSFHATFPRAAVYKLVLLFRPEGVDLPVEQSLAAEFYVTVEEGSVIQKFLAMNADGEWWKRPIWWLLFVTSLVLMLLLSLGVKKYLKID